MKYKVRKIFACAFAVLCGVTLIAQVYVTDDQCTVVRPVKELKGFEKVFLKPGEEKMLSLTLDQEAFRFYDPYKHDFVIEPGTFTISVGSSSADIRLDVSLNVE